MCARVAALIAGALTSGQVPSELADLLANVSPRLAYISVVLGLSRAGDGSLDRGGGTTGGGGACGVWTSNLLASPTCTFSIHSLHNSFVGRVMNGRRPARARAASWGR